jgi:hypothetical protein
MCELCGTEEEIEKGRKHAEYCAQLCDEARRFYLGLASGFIKPHTELCARRRLIVKSLVREIFEDVL